MSKRNGKDGASAYVSYQQKRRRLALERQQNDRQESLQRMRMLSQAAVVVTETTLQDEQMQEAAGTDAAAAASHADLQQEAATQLFGMDGVNTRELSGSALKSYYAKQLMQPEWMSDIPPDLAPNWLVMPRPEGRRCLVISSGGWTFSRSRTGAILHRFFSRLPKGGPKSMLGPNSYCVLDCIFQEDQQPQQQQLTQPNPRQDAGVSDVEMASECSACRSETAASDRSSKQASSSSQLPPKGTYYIQDVLSWRGYSLVDCGAEFRLHWLQSKLAEEGDGDWQLDGGPEVPGHQCRFKMLPYWKATPEGLVAAARFSTAANASSHPSAAAAIDQEMETQQQHHQFVQDGVYFRHVEGHYCLGGYSTPLALLWKDETCSRYLLDTDAAGVVPQYQQLILVYQGRASCGVATADDPPIVLGRLPAEFIEQMAKRLRAGLLLRFSIREGGILFNLDGSPAGADLAYEGPANQRRGRADLISKIMFQWQARRNPSRLDALLAASRASVELPAIGGGASMELADAAAVGSKSDIVSRLPETLW